MPQFRTGRIEAILSERDGLQRVTVRFDGGNPERAYVLRQLTGDVAVGDDVVVNTTAVELGLGTGGWHVVHWNLARDSWGEAGPGHIMKMRYTSLQIDTGAAEELLGEPDTDLGGLPVVACSLHSQVGVVCAAIAAVRPGTRVIYVMTDGAALPIALSDLVAELGAAQILFSTVTAGHAFGGDHEAVSIASGLTLARQLGAEVVVVGMGPGVVGTGSTLGTTAVEVASILDTAAALGALPIACVRWSDVDERPRHRELSHHTVTALTLVRSSVAVPTPDSRAHQLSIPVKHRVVEVTTPDMEQTLAELGLSITTMGRGPGDDPGFFANSAAAGAFAAGRVGSGSDGASPGR